MILAVLSCVLDRRPFFVSCVARDNPVTMEGKPQMTRLVTLTLTDGECLTVRMALNAVGMEWGNKAAAARAAGDGDDADTCERLREDHSRLWVLVQGAQEAGGRQPDWLARRGATADAMFASEARETARVAAECDALEADIPY